MSLLDMMEQDADAKVGFETLTDEGLSEVAKLAEEAVVSEREIERLSTLLEQKKKSLAFLVEMSLPNTLKRFGLLSLELTNGRKIVVEELLFCGITKENSPEANKWLVENNFGSIIKREVKTTFAKGEEENYQALVDVLKEKGFSFAANESVHYQTLRAFVKRELAKGTDLPVELFSIIKKNVAKIV